MNSIIFVSSMGWPEAIVYIVVVCAIMFVYWIIVEAVQEIFSHDSSSPETPKNDVSFEKKSSAFNRDEIRQILREMEKEKEKEKESLEKIAGTGPLAQVITQTAKEMAQDKLVAEREREAKELAKL